MAFNNAQIIRNKQVQVEKQLRGVVTVMGNMALNHFKSSFVNQGFTDDSVQKWQPRKRISYRTRSGKKVNEQNRSLLVKTGDLRRSLRKINVTNYSVTIATDKKYARIHNEGLEGRAFGKYPFKMPKRQFIGYSGKLNRSIIDMFNLKINSIFAK